MQKKSFSWGIIILMLILFFPVAIFMIIKKMNDEKFNYIKNGKSLKILGWVLVGFTVVYLIMGLTGNLKTEDGTSTVGGVIIAIIIFGGSGALSVLKGCQYIKRGEKINRYVSIINSSGDLIIDNIAAAMPTTYDKAVADIQTMLDAGYFMNSYIDNNRRELVMPKLQCDQNFVINYNYNTPDSVKVEKPHSVKCPNCGAANAIMPDAVNECEYCGSPL